MYNPGLGAIIQRVFFSLLFVAAGIMHIMNWEGTVQSTASVFGTQFAFLISVGAVAFILGGGVLLLVGFMSRSAGGLLVLFLIAGGYAHWVWAGMAPDDMLREAQLAHLMKNFALLGVACRYAFGD